MDRTTQINDIALLRLLQLLCPLLLWEKTSEHSHLPQIQPGLGGVLGGDKGSSADVRIDALPWF